MPQLRRRPRHVTPEDRMRALDNAKSLIRILGRAPPMRIPIPGMGSGDEDDDILSGMLSDASLSVDTSIQTGVYGSEIGVEGLQQEVTQPQEGRISPDMATELPNGSLGTSLEELLGNGTVAPATEGGLRSISLPDFFRNLSDSIMDAPDEEAEAKIIEAFTILLELSKRMRREHHFTFFNEEVLEDFIDILSQ